MKYDKEYLAKRKGSCDNFDGKAHGTEKWKPCAFFAFIGKNKEQNRKENENKWLTFDKNMVI